MKAPGTVPALALAAASLVTTATAQHGPALRPAPHSGCEVTSIDAPAGAVLPEFDPASWSVFAPRTSVTFQVFLDDPGNQLAAFAPAILSNMQAACDRWASLLQPPPTPAVITVLVRVDNTYPRATGRSETTVFVGAADGYDIFDQGAAYEARTGVDPNGTVHDAVVTLNTSYTANELWFDPNPATRTAPVPQNRTDAVSVFLHELGHIIMFNGWRDNYTGIMPGLYQSPFDQFTTFDGDFYFHGTQCTGLYGSPAPLTYGNAKHLGNNSPRPGADLIPDLMNGVVFYRGSRYDASPLDLAVGRDCGVPFLGGGTACDTIDFNNDGLFPDTSDIDDFLSVFSGGACSNDPNCNDIDYNNDGLFPDTLDIDAMLSVFSGGACLV
ncbi:MAG TPA: hypothetical protein VHN77_10550 [Phycisphaerales bacterium]|nr:hypothetical protein [Phycisphaerales bacterium]